MTPKSLELGMFYFTVGQSASLVLHLRQLQSRSTVDPCVVIMILRVVAIYGQSKKIFAFLFSLWAFQIIMSSVGLGTGYRKCLSEVTFSSSIQY
jgi:hypothetical protein